MFKYVYTVPVDGGTNMEVFASNEAGLPEMLKKNTEKLPDGELKGMMETVSAELTGYEGKDRILTDDKAPVELLGMKVLDEIIGEELDYYRELYLG